MATLTDEEKVEELLGDVESEKSTDETPKESETTTETEQEPVEEAETEETEPEESQEETEEEETEAESTTFTKQFPNLKGETLEEYVPELEKAYQNSFTEALRLNKELQDNAAIVEQAKAVIANQPAETTEPTTPATTTAPSLTQPPELQFARDFMMQQMTTAFESFAEKYPQVRDQDEFEKFRKASDGVSAALEASTGRKPSYPELFDSIANTFGWIPAVVDAKKANSIKETISSTRSSSATPPPPRRTKVTDAEIEVYQKLSRTPVTREQAVKALSEVK